MFPTRKIRKQESKREKKKMRVKVGFNFDNVSIVKFSIVNGV